MKKLLILLMYLIPWQAFAGTLTLTINANGNDGYRIDQANLMSSIIDPATTGRHVVYAGNGVKKMFLTWVNVTVPVGALIDSARIMVTNSKKKSTGKVYLRVAAYDTSNGVAPTDSAKYTAQLNLLTPQTEAWTISNPDSTPGSNTYNLYVTRAVARVCGKATWASGNAITFHFVDDPDSASGSGYYLAPYANEEGSGQAQLIINYTESTPPPQTVTDGAKGLIFSGHYIDRRNGRIW